MFDNVVVIKGMEHASVQLVVSPLTPPVSTNHVKPSANESSVELGLDTTNDRPMFYVGDELIMKSESSARERPLVRDGKIIHVGICSMAKKANSKPMQEILNRLERFQYIQVVIFEESVILNEDVERWPLVDVLIAFFSHGFPLEKAVQYEKIRKPFMINNLQMQYILQDRREVYRILKKEGIAHPRYAVLNRNFLNDPNIPFTESEDAIEVAGDVFPKPFVEKPVNAEDHNVYIYFPVAAGGGSQRLFRKQLGIMRWGVKKQIAARSSVYSPMNRVRKTGSYIYEEFMPTDGTDVKVYAVGPNYAHAEARKSPALDGKVERDKDGKEVRYPVILSAKEKIIAREVSLAFKQTVCGFDLLRANGKSYVCDVNGFSFVKNSGKYYDDCAKILGTMIMRTLAPQLDIPWVLGAAPEDAPVVPTTSGSMMELCCVIAVIRHGDRTPKQKMKMEVKHRKFFELFKKYEGFKSGHLKLKKPKQLQEVLDIVRFLLNENKTNKDEEVEEKKAKLEQLKLVLEMYGRFSGINRKVQLKYQPHGRPKRSSSEEVDEDGASGIKLAKHCRYKFTGINRKVQMKYQPLGYGFRWSVSSDGANYALKENLKEEAPREPSLVLILKWGGELTPAGKIQAEELGKAFRTLYPGGQGEFGAPGLGFLRLHSTFRHDLKIYASDEGRVQMTAAGFTKGLLALEGELTPILVQMVKSANTNGLLDNEGEMSKHQQIVKEKLKEILNQDSDFSEEDYIKLSATGSISLMNAMNFVKNPRKLCEKVHEMVREITAKIRALKLELKTRDLKLYHGESWELLIRRWSKLEKDFKMKCGQYDISKIPDIYDCIKYDLQHNYRTLQYDRAEELFNYSKALADIVIPQEYGITKEEKLQIGQSFCTPLLRKIHSDLQQCLKQEDEETTRLDSRYSKGVSSPGRFVRTRLYFTSESHIHSLLTMIRYAGLCDENKDEQWKRAMEYISATGELNYMTQIVIMMFEDPNKDVSSPERYHIELHFSPGAYTCCDTNQNIPQGSGYRTITKITGTECETSHKVKVSIGTVVTEDNFPTTSTRTDSGSISRGREKKADIKPLVIQQPVMEEEFNADVFPEDTSSGRNSDKEEHTKPKKSVTIVPGPRSPDPDAPEWDWGDSDATAGSSPLSETTSACNNLPSEKIPSNLELCSPSSTSMPINIIPTASQPKIVTTEEDTEQFAYHFVPLDEKPCYMKTVRSQSLEEKRSRSLEDKPKVSPPSTVNLFDRHYLTVHLPIADYKHRHSFSSLFAMKSDYVPAFKSYLASLRGATGLLRTSVLTGSASAPDLVTAYRVQNDEGIEGFTMVPSVRPLETLHNSLTLKDMDVFLMHAMTMKFSTPSSPACDMSTLPSKLAGTSSKASCSSNNSSTGSSSPSGSTPMELMQRLVMFISDSKQQKENEDPKSTEVE